MNKKQVDIQNPAGASNNIPCIIIINFYSVMNTNDTVLNSVKHKHTLANSKALLKRQENLKIILEYVDYIFHIKAVELV